MLKSLVLALSCAALITGCALAHGPVIAPVTINMKGPVSAGPANTGSKMGRAEAWYRRVRDGRRKHLGRCEKRRHHPDSSRGPGDDEHPGVLRQVHDDRLRGIAVPAASLVAGEGSRVA